MFHVHLLHHSNPNLTLRFWLLIIRVWQTRLILVLRPIEPLLALKGLVLYQAQSGLVVSHGSLANLA